MDSKREASQVLNSNPQGRRLRGRPKTDGVTVYRQISTNTKLQTGKRRKEQSWLREVHCEVKVHVGQQGHEEEEEEENEEEKKKKKKRKKKKKKREKK